MPTEAPRPGEGISVHDGQMHTPPRPPDQEQLLEELAQVEHQLEALAEYRKQLRAKIEGMGADDAG